MDVPDWLLQCYNVFIIISFFVVKEQTNKIKAYGVSVTFPPVHSIKMIAVVLNGQLRGKFCLCFLLNDEFFSVC